jgi:serine/threonine protein kinase/HEAT repeat protein
MDAEFHREYLLRLPLPLAQLYSRAYNAKDARSRHDNCYYLFEVLIKLSACPLTACYVQGLRRGGQRVAKLDQLLLPLALPSLGHWMEILREMARHYGSLPDAASHPLGQMWGQLNRAHRDPSAFAALYRRIKNGADGQPSGEKSCTILQLFGALVQYRNGVIGHGAGRFESFYANDMGPLLFPAVNEVLAEGVFSPLGPSGARLAYLTDLRAVSEDRFELEMRELTGPQGERMAPLTLQAGEEAGLAPNRVAVLWPGWRAPLQLNPLMIFRESEMTDEVLLLNGDRSGRQVEYLSYMTGRTERTKDTVRQLAALLSILAGKEVTESKLQELAEQSRALTASVEALTEPAGPVRRLGDYEILAEIGRGGMGVVYLARQLSLGRLVALKMLPADLTGDEVALARFRREMRALGRCDHPNIVKLLDSGAFPDGQVYYTMEYVYGCDLEQVWNELSRSGLPPESSKLGNTTFARAVISASGRRRKEVESRCAAFSAGEAKTAGGREPPAVPKLPLPPLPEAADDSGGYVRKVAALIRDAAHALQTVHDQGIVCRDISPANLMLTPDGTHVVLIDFGLAKGQNLSRSLTEKGGFVGKMRYAAPEQLASANLEVGPRADVRGLGVTLWELLTRHRLFERAQDELQLAALVHSEDVPRLRQVDPSFDPDLEAIVARATERNADDRIQSAGKLAEYLQLYLDGKPLPIRPPTRWELARRWSREHKVLVRTAVVLLLAAATVMMVLAWPIVSALRRIENPDARVRRAGWIQLKSRAPALCLRKALAHLQSAADERSQMEVLSILDQMEWGADRDRILRALAGILENSGDSTRKFGAAVAGPRATAEWILDQQLQSRNVDVVRLLMPYLSDKPEPKAAAQLKQWLTDKDPRIRESAQKALATRASNRLLSSQELAAWLADPNVAVREFSASAAAASTGDARLIEALLARVASMEEDGVVRKAAAESLVALQAQVDLPALEKILSNEEDLTVARATATLMGRSQDPKAIEVLCRSLEKVLHDRYPQLWVPLGLDLVKYIGERGKLTEEVKHVLQACLDASDSGLNVAAMQAMRHIDLSAAEARDFAVPLARFLSSPDATARRMAVAALEDLAVPETVPAMIQALTIYRNDVWLCSALEDDLVRVHKKAFESDPRVADQVTDEVLRYLKGEHVPFYEEFQIYFVVQSSAPSTRELCAQFPAIKELYSLRKLTWPLEGSPEPVRRKALGWLKALTAGRVDANVLTDSEVRQLLEKNWAWDETECVFRLQGKDSGRAGAP